MDLQPQPQLLEPILSPDLAPILVAFCSLPVCLTLHQDLDLVGIPAQVHDEGKEVIPKKKRKRNGGAGRAERAGKQCWGSQSVKLGASNCFLFSQNQIISALKKPALCGKVHVLLAAEGLSQAKYPPALLPSVRCKERSPCTQRLGRELRPLHPPLLCGTAAKKQESCSLPGEAY